MMLSALTRAIGRLRSFFKGGAEDRDFQQEMESHLQMATDDNIRRGMTPEAARRQAAIRLGGVSSLAVQHRDTRGMPALDSVLQDLRFATRLILKERWFSAAAVAAIALGIGANTVGFTIINAAFLRGFAFERADELRIISWRPDRGRRLPSSALDLEGWRTQATSFSTIGGYAIEGMNLSGDDAAPERTQGGLVTANLFDVLRQRPLVGRAFAEGEDRRGADPVAVIGHDLWTTRYAQDPGVIGRIVRVNGTGHTIVGVMPERMKFPDNAELWVPFVPTDVQLARHARRLGVVGRLRDGVGDREAEAEIDAIAKRTIAAYPDDTRGIIGGQIETLLERFLGGMARPMFVTVMGAVTFVLLIACANVANLLLSRAAHRAREVAVRYSLGATRWRIVRQLLIESLTLSCVGGVLGLALAAAGVDAFAAAVQQAQAPYWLQFTIDYRVLAYVAAICVGTGVLFGLAPALQLSRDDQHDTLKDGGRGNLGTRRGGRFGNALVVAELTLTVVLLCGAGLMVRSFATLYTLDPGFDVDGLARMRLQLPPEKYPTPQARAAFFDALQPRILALPGIRGSAITTSSPPRDDEAWRVAIDGRPPMDDERRPFVGTVTVSHEYLSVLGVAITRGRGLSAADGTPGSENVVISHAMAERHFPDEDPIGRRIRFVPREDEPDAPPQPWRTIVGVSAPFLQGSTDEAFRSPVVFLPLRQAAPRTAALMIRSALPPAQVMSAVRSAVQAIDPDQPLFPIESASAVIEFERLFHSLFSAVFGLVAAIGLTLSAVGVYGVMAYAVTQRTQEIGVRMALGARRSQVMWMFARRSLTQLALGLAIGLPGALALGQVVRFNLVEIEPSDPLTLIGITVLLALVAFAASVFPVRSASRVDPVIALRSE